MASAESSIESIDNDKELSNDLSRFHSPRGAEVGGSNNAVCA